MEVEFPKTEMDVLPVNWENRNMKIRLCEVNGGDSGEKLSWLQRFHDGA